MIVKGYIVGKGSAPNKYVVRIPTFNGIEGKSLATPDRQLSEAIICSVPGANNLVHTGDCVIIGFENDDLSKPIILGHLFKQTFDSQPLDLSIRQLKVYDTNVPSAALVELPSNTKIGSISSENLATLAGNPYNLATTLTYILDKIKNIEDKLETL